MSLKFMHSLRSSESIPALMFGEALVEEKLNLPQTQIQRHLQMEIMLPPLVRLADREIL